MHFRYDVACSSCSFIFRVLRRKKMDRFRNLNLDTIGNRYNQNDLPLVRDLMAAGLLSPECHGPVVLTSSRPWLWRCMGGSIASKSVGKKKFLAVFKANYMIARKASLTTPWITLLLSLSSTPPTEKSQPTRWVLPLAHQEAVPCLKQLSWS